MRSIFFSLFIIAVLAVTAVCLYWVFYKHRINKRLRDDNMKSLKMLSPLAFSVIAIFVVLLASAGLSILLALGGSDLDKVPREYIDAVYDYQDYRPSQMTGYRSIYSIDENAGYTKKVEQQGDIRFTCFIRDDTFDYYHPAFIIYAEYTGSKDILYTGIQTYFYAPDGRQMTGEGHAGSDFEGYLCVIGTSTIQSTFELNVYLYDSTLKGEDMEEYAVANGTITVSVP